MANDIFSRAKAYRKKHPRTAWADCVKACAGKKKKAVGKRPKKTAAAARPVRKIKVKLKPGKKGAQSITIGKAKHKKRSGGLLKSLGISGISINKVKQELQHQQSLQSAKAKHLEMLRQKGLRPAEKAAIRRDIKSYSNSINASKKHVSALKRSI